MVEKSYFVLFGPTIRYCDAGSIFAVVARNFGEVAFAKYVCV